MTAAIRARDDGAESFPAASVRINEDLELPRPLRLALTAGGNLSESVGLPVAAYVVAAWPFRARPVRYVMCRRQAGGQSAHSATRADDIGARLPRAEQSG
jgi:hypothetical protein